MIYYAKCHVRVTWCLLRLRVLINIMLCFCCHSLSKYGVVQKSRVLSYFFLFYFYFWDYFAVTGCILIYCLSLRKKDENWREEVERKEKWNRREGIKLRKRRCFAICNRIRLKVEFFYNSVWVGNNYCPTFGIFLMISAFVVTIVIFTRRM